MLPSTKYQGSYDIQFINKMIDYLKSYISEKYPQALPDFNIYEGVVKQAEKVTQSQINFKEEIENADKLQELMYDNNSCFYIPYYYKKYTSDQVIIREFIEGVHLGDSKGLKEIGLTSDIGYAFVMA